MERRRSLLGVNNSMYNYEICQYAKTLSFQGNTTITSVKFGDMPNLTSTREMFSGCSNLTSVEIGDLPNVADTYFMFAHSPITNIKIGNVNAISSMFNRSLVVNIEIGDFSNAANTTYMFLNCFNLENITINGSTCAVSFGLPQSSKLTHTSLMNIINALPTVETQQTLTLHATAKARLSEEDIAIASAKNWQII